MPRQALSVEVFSEFMDWLYMAFDNEEFMVERCGAVERRYDVETVLGVFATLYKHELMTPTHCAVFLHIAKKRFSPNKRKKICTPILLPGGQGAGDLSRISLQNIYEEIRQHHQDLSVQSR